MRTFVHQVTDSARADGVHRVASLTDSTVKPLTGTDGSCGAGRAAPGSTGNMQRSKSRLCSWILSNPRNWYGSAVRDEISTVSGERRSEFVEKFGEEMADNRLQSSTLKMKAVDAGELRLTHFRAVKI